MLGNIKQVIVRLIEFVSYRLKFVHIVNIQ